MNITNGTIEFEHPKKIADYEIKRVKVSLSYSLAEGEDEDLALALVSTMVHKQVMDMLRRPEVVPVSNVRDQPKPAKVPPKAAAEPVEAPTSATPLPEQSGDSIITDDAMMKACQRATARLHSPVRTKAVINKYVKKVGMSVITVPQEKRAKFIVELDALKHEEAT